MRAADLQASADATSADAADVQASTDATSADAADLQASADATAADAADVQSSTDAADFAADVYVFGDAGHQLLVVGTAAEGFRLWCRRCDRMGTRSYGSFSVAQHYVAAAKRDIAPACHAVERSV
jgi:hypothetical protein